MYSEKHLLQVKKVFIVQENFAKKHRPYTIYFNTCLSIFAKFLTYNKVVSMYVLAN